MSILSLPNELLQSIFDSLESETEINALVCTHPYLYHHFNPFLYTHNVAESSSSAIIWAVTRGRSDTLQKVIQQSGNIEVRDATHDQTPLAIAIEKGHIAIAHQLLDHGADVSAKNRYRQTPLFEAALLGDEGLARRLVELGADVDPTDIDMESPLHSALYRKHDRIVEFLLERGADPNRRDDIGENTPLHIAIRNFNITNIRLLLEYRADPGMRYSDLPPSFMQPIHLAVLKGHDSAVQRLLEMGADRAWRDASGQTLMDIAERAGFGELMRPLLE